MDKSQILKSLKKQFKDIVLADDERRRVVSMSTSILSLDVALGGGIPRGFITHIWGPDGGGKTTTMASLMKSAASERAVNGLTLYIDMEQKADPSMFVRYGVDRESIIFVKTVDKDNPIDGNMAVEIIKQMIGEVDLIIVDSVAGMMPKIAHMAESDSTIIGIVAKLLSMQLPLIASKLGATQTALVLLNQERASMSRYGMDTKPFAGYALSHWASVRGRIRNSGWIKEDNKVVGFRPKLTVEKHDFFPPRGEAQWDVRFDSGVDEMADLISAAKSVGVVTALGGYIYAGDISLNSEGRRGLEDAKANLRNNPELAQEVRRMTIERTMSNVEEQQAAF